MENISKSALIKKGILILAKLVMFLILYLVFFKIIFSFIRVTDTNMNPNIKEGDLLLVYKLDNDYDSGDVILAEIDGKEVITRIVALSKSKVDIDKSGIVLIDGYEEDREVFYKTSTSHYDISYPYEVDSDEFFVLNDNRNNEDDSRKFGSISIDQIKGKVVSKLQVRNI